MPTPHTTPKKFGCREMNETKFDELAYKQFMYEIKAVTMFLTNRHIDANSFSDY